VDPHATGATASVADPTDALAVRLRKVSNYAAGVAQEPMPPQRHEGLWIEIPSLKISLPIREGDGSDRIPQWMALHYPGTVAPGAAGNSYLYAHGLWGMFGGLLFARQGDLVELHDYGSGAVTTLHVSRVVGRTGWNDVTWIHERATAPTLTLQTCIDLDPHGDRYVVQAT